MSSLLLSLAGILAAADEVCAFMSAIGEVTGLPPAGPSSVKLDFPLAKNGVVVGSLLNVAATSASESRTRLTTSLSIYFRQRSSWPCST